MIIPNVWKNINPNHQPVDIVSREQFIHDRHLDCHVKVLHCAVKLLRLRPQ